MKRSEAVAKFQARREVVASAILDAVAGEKPIKPQDVIELKVCDAVLAVLGMLEDVA